MLFQSELVCFLGIVKKPFSFLLNIRSSFLSSGIPFTSINEKYNSNKPTKRQEEGFVTFKELEDTRDKLKKGSIRKDSVPLHSDNFRI